MRIILLSLICLFFFSSNFYSNTYKKYIKYTDPVPNAKYVKTESNVLLRFNESVTPESVFQNGAISLTGSLGGEYSFQPLTSDDEKTIILKPSRFFVLGEKITVKFSSAIKILSNRQIEPFSYSFEIETKKIYLPKNFALEREISGAMKQQSMNYSDMVTGFPNITVSYYNGPSRGHIFLGSVAFGPPGPNTPHLIILNNNGQPFYSKEMQRPCFDFNLQPNGNPTYYIGTFGGKYYEMDSSNYSVIDSFYCDLGDSTDLHELRLLPNRHALLMSYDPQPVDMSKIVEGGYKNAIVIGLIIQEIDSEKNVVFRWRSWDHFQITDATHEDLTDTMVDYSHGNAIELDNDGNLMISSRHMDEITKINRTTGDIMWRLGGKNNQFTFVNDPDKFSYQHAIRRISNGNITLFDNGNYHNPPHSRAVEYHLDETNKVATLVWQYRNSPDVFGPAMGFVQRLGNGNTLISWGFAPTTITEVKYNGTKVLEIKLPQGVYTYRAFKYNFKDNGTSGQIVPQSFVLQQNYPNPFNPGTTIKFGIPNIEGDAMPLNTKLSVFDMLGREVAVLVDEDLLPDSYTVQFDGTNFASGVYFYRLTTPLFKETKRMVLVK